jgi:hypothetical protein
LATAHPAAASGSPTCARATASAESAAPLYRLTARFPKDRRGYLAHAPRDPLDDTDAHIGEDRRGLGSAVPGQQNADIPIEDPLRGLGSGPAGSVQEGVGRRLHRL